MPESVIRVMCPNLRCRTILAVPGEARGRLVRCRGCGTNIKVPPKQEAPKVEEAAPATDGKSAKPAA